MQVTTNASTASTGTKGKGNKGQVSTGKGGKPVPANAVFAAVVATQQKQASKASTATAATAAVATMPNVATAAHVQAHAGFVRPVQNGRKGYAPNTVGALIWQTATALQAQSSAPITASVVRLALPHVAPASVSAGLSHWRKFCGTLRVKGMPRPSAPSAPLVTAPVPQNPAPAGNAIVLPGALPVPLAQAPVLVIASR